MKKITATIIVILFLPLLFHFFGDKTLAQGLTTADNRNDTLITSFAEVTISEEILDNAYVLSPILNIEAPIHNSLLFLGGNLEVNQVITNDLHAKAATVVLNANVYGDVRIFAERVIINSEVIDGNLDVVAGEYYLSPDLIVTGKQSIHAANLLTNVDQSKSEANQSYLAFITSYIFTQSNYSATTLYYRLVMLFGIFLFSYFIIKFFPVFSDKTSKTMRTSRLSSVAYGLLAAAISFVIGVLCYITPGAITIIILFAPMVLLVPALSIAFSAYEFGQVAAKTLQLKNLGRALTLLLGLIFLFGILEAISFIPILKLSLYLAFGLLISAWTAGAILQNKLSATKN